MSELSFNKKVGMRITKRRNVLNMQPKELSYISGISKSTIYKYERGEMMPSFKGMCKIAKVLGVPVSFFDVGD